VECLDLVLIGFGNVGRRFARLLAETSSRLERDCDLTWRIVGIATGRHGAVLDPAGIDVGQALRRTENGQRLDTLRHGGPPGDESGPALTPGLDLIRRLDALGGRSRHQVIVETTILDVRHGQPATDHVREALRTGRHVVTANKGPVAFAYAELRDLARSVGREFLFEGAVMDGVPVFNLVRETLPAAEVVGFRGIINSTTNHILTAMEEGREFDAALAEMQRAGIAEADASLDVDGWDAAAKAAALANVLMAGGVTPADVDRTGIARVTGADVRAAVAAGQRLRLIASARREEGRVRASVAPRLIPGTDLLAGLRGMQNGLVLETDVLGEVAIVQLGSGLAQTAYALLSDLVTVRRGL
jgi:homoserine dehydrogenase